MIRSSYVRITGRYVIMLGLDWRKLVIAVVSAVLGWLSGYVYPAPGNVAAPTVQVK